MKSRLGVILVSVGFVVIMVATVIYSTIGLNQFEVESCITYKGRSNCGTAAGESREQALRASATIACSTIAGGMTESIACSRTAPDSLRWIRGQ